MIPIKVKSNKIFTKETIDKCKESFFSQRTCAKENCKGLAMGNNYCRWHGGENSEIQKQAKRRARIKRNNNCNVVRQALRKNDKKAYKNMMETIKSLKDLNVDE